MTNKTPSKITFKPSPEQLVKLQSLGRYVNLSQLMRDSLEIVLSRIEVMVKDGDKN